MIFSYGFNKQYSIFSVLKSWVKAINIGKTFIFQTSIHSDLIATCWSQHVWHSIGNHKKPFYFVGTIPATALNENITSFIKRNYWSQIVNHNKCSFDCGHRIDSFLLLIRRPFRNKLINWVDHFAIACIVLLALIDNWLISLLRIAGLWWRFSGVCINSSTSCNNCA